MKIYASKQSDVDFLKHVKGKDIWVFCRISGGYSVYDTTGYIQVVDIKPTKYYYQDEYGRMSPIDDYICDYHIFKCDEGLNHPSLNFYSMRSTLNYIESAYVNYIKVERPVDVLRTEELIELYGGGIDQ